jgi:hypothetical protein
MTRNRRHAREPTTFPGKWTINSGREKGAKSLIRTEEDVFKLLLLATSRTESADEK